MSVVFPTIRPVGPGRVTTKEHLKYYQLVQMIVSLALLQMQQPTNETIAQQETDAELRALLIEVLKASTIYEDGSVKPFVVKDYESLRFNSIAAMSSVVGRHRVRIHIAYSDEMDPVRNIVLTMDPEVALQPHYLDNETTQFP